MVEQPQPEVDYWPNDRLLRYYDFQVLPHINPLRFIKENNKVSPNVHLAVTDAGIVQREKLDDASEQILRWRIYHDGRVVERGAATGNLSHAVTQGVGSYVAFVGVDGPNGFMPVSNFLQFPLFSERNGRTTLFPSTASGDGYPDFLVDALDSDQLSRLRNSEHQTEPHAAYNEAVIRDLGLIGPIADEKNQRLISLWSSWAWNVTLAKANPTSDIARINMVVGAKPNAK